MVDEVLITKPGNYTYTLDQPEQELCIHGRLNVTAKDTLTLTVIHQAPYTQANLDLRAVVHDQAMVTIHGQVIVRPKAHHTDSFLSEKVLLLSPTAKAEAVPNLEILNHEVKCAHAATIGQIDEDQIFYLMSRGISLTEAKNILAEAFLKVK